MLCLQVTRALIISIYAMLEALSLFIASCVKALCLADGLDIAHSKLHGNMLKQTLKHYQVDNSM